MTRRLFFLGTALFWVVVASLWAAGRGAVTPAQATKEGPEVVYGLADVARHATETDCWMAIHGNVYDLTAYLPEHPSRPSVIVPWCGREASEAYRTKTKGRAHSTEADRMLADHRIGRLKE